MPLNHTLPKGSHGFGKNFKEEMAFFDKLPLELRRKINKISLTLSAGSIAAYYRKNGMAKTLSKIDVTVKNALDKEKENENEFQQAN